MRGMWHLVLCSALVSCAGTPTEVAVSAADLPLAEDSAHVGRSALRVGAIRMSGADTTLLELPGVARRGEVAALYLTTYAGGCVGRDTTVTRVDGLRVDVVPYQRVFVPPAGGACTDNLVLERRTIRVTFATTGEAVIRVVGRVWPDRGLVAIQRRLVVQ